MTAGRDAGEFDCRCGHIPALRGLLERHPRFRPVDGATADAVSFVAGGRTRTVEVGARGEPFGLVELMDNNPLVCADRVYVPDPASTLGLIAFAPLARAGLLLERPVLHTSCPGEEDELSRSLSRCGYAHGCTCVFLPDSADVVWAGATVAISGHVGLEDLQELFSEAYARSFFIRPYGPGPGGNPLELGLVEFEPPARSANEPAERSMPTSVLRPAAGARSGGATRPYAQYHLHAASRGTSSPLEISVAADLHGKCGAAQIVHVMNVMAGFEETLGL